jgi:large subunit ribosomal protein L31
MRAEIHPRYDLTTIACAGCGAHHAVRSTRSGLSVDVCAECHPVYTGVERAAARGGRVERFEARRARASSPVLAPRG